MTSGSLSLERARELLAYDPVTGEMRWRVYRNHLARAGSIAGWIDMDGYRRVTVGKLNYLVHRIAFLLMNGAWPVEQVDHIDGDRTNNVWSNLRECTLKQNAMNRIRKKGCRYNRGVWCSERNLERPWFAKLDTGRKRLYLGYFRTEEEASAAYEEALRKHSGAFFPDRDFLAGASCKDASRVA